MRDGEAPITLDAEIAGDGERRCALRVRELRRGAKNCRLEIVLDESRNLQIRRILEALGKGEWRMVSESGITTLRLRDYVFPQLCAAACG